MQTVIIDVCEVKVYILYKYIDIISQYILTNE